MVIHIASGRNDSHCSGLCPSNRLYIKQVLLQPADGSIQTTLISRM